MKSTHNVYFYVLLFLFFKLKLLWLHFKFINLYIINFLLLSVVLSGVGFCLCVRACVFLGGRGWQNGITCP